MILTGSVLLVGPPPPLLPQGPVLCGPGQLGPVAFKPLPPVPGAAGWSPVWASLQPLVSQEASGGWARTRCQWSRGGSLHYGQLRMVSRRSSVPVGGGARLSAAAAPRVHQGRLGGGSGRHRSHGTVRRLWRPTQTSVTIWRPASGELQSGPGTIQWSSVQLFMATRQTSVINICIQDHSKYFDQKDVQNFANYEYRNLIILWLSSHEWICCCTVHWLRPGYTEMLWVRHKPGPGEKLYHFSPAWAFFVSVRVWAARAAGAGLCCVTVIGPTLQHMACSERRPSLQTEARLGQAAAPACSAACPGHTRPVPAPVQRREAGNSSQLPKGG